MQGLIALGIAAGAGLGYWWWKNHHAVPIAATFQDPRTGSEMTVPTDLKFDSGMSDFQRKEALGNLIGVLGDPSSDTVTKIGVLRQQANAYRTQGYPIAAKEYEDSAKYLEGGAFPPWYGKLSAATGST